MHIQIRQVEYPVAMTNPKHQNFDLGQESISNSGSQIILL